MGGQTGEKGNVGDTGDAGETGNAGETGELEMISPKRSIKFSSKMSFSSSSYPPEARSYSHIAAGVWVGLSSKPSISINTPSAIHGVASLRTWSDTLCGMAPWMTPSDLFLGSGSSIVAGWSPQSVVGTCNFSIASLAGGRLVSGGAGVGLVTMSSSAGPTVNGEWLFTSTHSKNEEMSEEHSLGGVPG